ncbi:hypothetical protein HC723_15710 [Vibrio sp. S11_S32]|uniref:toprim domain-containing protein n=1 Tax=Vibrio sp. S11_S32 TaxID=2720225 RepID=UPI001680776E|nr:toprim domain-containing protein [Vibrio sp. S11_S32]MBD1577844.1 hypothetical protein [Vibrio sp. S11_S32]
MSIYRETTREKNARILRDVKELAHGNWTRVLSYIEPKIEGAASGFTGIKRPAIKCPYHNAKSNTSFRFLKSGDETGACGCFTCGVWKDGFDFLMNACHMTFPEAIKQVADAVGYTDHEEVTEEERQATLKRIAEAKRKREENEKIQQALNIKARDRMLLSLSKMWLEAVALDHDLAKPARSYFKNRGLGNVGTLRGEIVFHPALEYRIFDKEAGTFHLAGKYPCILSQIRNATGVPVRIHRTYITEEGQKLMLSDESPKKMTPAIPLVPITGGSIQLSPAGTKVIGIGEGLETTLAAMKVTKMPMQCCINAQLLSSWLPAKGTEVVFVWVDKDRSKTGILRAKELEERLKTYGVKVILCEPPLPIPENESGIDWADVLNSIGSDGFPEEAKNWQQYL